MTISLGVVMDPISAINPKKDSTLAMLLAAQARGWSLRYMEMADLSMHGSQPVARVRTLTVRDDLNDWYTLDEPANAAIMPMGDLDVVLMRKDPPFDIEYIYATYILEQAQHRGALVVNAPRTLRDANEKMFTAWFPQCTPPTLVTRRHDELRAFLYEHGDIVVKPLEGMGGASIFHISSADKNTSVILETLTHHQSRFAMAQRYLPEIVDGDKRLLLIDGEPVPYCLARIPASGELRGNLAAGGRGEARELTERDYWICREVGPVLRERGLVFVGLDVIGDYLTEINVTSPTCIREIDAAFDTDIGGQLMTAIERRLEAR